MRRGWRWGLGSIIVLGFAALLTLPGIGQGAGGWWPGRQTEGATGEALTTNGEALARLRTDSCAQMKQGDLVLVVGERSGYAGSSVPAYRASEVEALMLPASRIAPTFVDNPMGVYWDIETRTATLLGPVDVLSVHFPVGKDQVQTGIQNGEKVEIQATICEDGFYLPLEVLVDVLQLQVIWQSEGIARLLPR